MRICRAAARYDDDVALVFAQLGERRLRTGMAALLDRRLIAPQALRRFLRTGPRDLTAAIACRSAAERLAAIFAGVRDGVDVFLNDGPMDHPQFAMLADDIKALAVRRQAAQGFPGPPYSTPEEQAAFRALIDRLRAYFLTQDGKPRGQHFAGTGFSSGDCHTDDAWRRHRASAAQLAPPVADAIRAFRRDLNAVMARGVWRIFAVVLHRYQSTLEGHALLDFSGVLERAVALLKQMDEFAESRLRLEARYRHVLVDEFQDTSRAQWDLVRQLVKSWGQGMGAAHDSIAPSIFIVGDRKQSIYGFRDADVSLVDEAAGFIAGLRQGSETRRAITVSFRAAPGILAFVNDVFDAIVAAECISDRRDGFRYDDRDRFPIEEVQRQPGFDGVYAISGDTVAESADLVAQEIVALLAGATVRDRATGLSREARAADIAILFRSRDSHRDFEAALERRGIVTYVYKGLGFFDADEVQDAVALLRYLADPLSNLRAAAFLRSRIARISDNALALLGSSSASTLLEQDTPPCFVRLTDEDRRVLERLRAAVPRWLSWVDRVTPSALLDAVLRETAHVYETLGPRRRQARENLKKLGGMMRLAQHRGYATLARIAEHLERLAVGDESNAAIDAIDAVSLMTVHAAKGLEFPIVFVVNMGRGTGGVRPPIRVSDTAAGDAAVAIADYQSEADEDAQARDREESKRLLYVALTRARDRLYLSMTLKDGAIRMGRGSLGEVLPGFVKDMFNVKR